MIGRREFLTLVGGAAAAWPVAARAQQGERIRRIGVLFAAPDRAAEFAAVLREALARLGWVEGRNLRIDLRPGDSDPERLRVYADELVGLIPAVIFTSGNTAARAVQMRTQTIPIVFVGAGAVAKGNTTVGNITHPESNLTGFANKDEGIEGKWMQLLKEVAPRLARVNFIYADTIVPDVVRREIASVEAAARPAGVTVISTPFHDATTVERAIDDFAQVPNGGLIVNSNIIFHRDSRRQARRSAGPASDQIRPGDQPQDRQGARSHDPADDAHSRRRCNRMIARRDFITLLGSAVAWPLAARAQQQTVPVLGFLSGASREERYVGALRQGLRDAGFIDGRNVTIEGRYADDRYERLPTLAAELIARRVAVIVADPRGFYAAQQLTKTIPIVFMSGGDPVATGRVTRLDRPGGNATGVTTLASDLNAKRFGLFHDLVPQAKLVGVLSDSTNRSADSILQDVQGAAGRLGVPIKVIAVGSEGEIETAFATFAREGASAVFFNNGFLFFSLRGRLNELALRYRMASSGEAREFVADGGLMSYGPSIPDAYRKVGVYAGRILKGEKPGDLPVQLPTKFEFLLNLQTARAIGLTVPPDILTVADEVIE
jgi:putative ABC transport system substrate-binding protein